MILASSNLSVTSLLLVAFDIYRDGTIYTLGILRMVDRIRVGERLIQVIEYDLMNVISTFLLLISGMTNFSKRMFVWQNRLLKSYLVKKQG